MIRIFSLLAIVCVTSVFHTAEAKKKKCKSKCVAETVQVPVSEIDSVSYAIGVQIGNSLKKDQLDTILSLSMIQMGLNAAFTGDTNIILKDEAAYKVLSQYFMKQAEIKANAAKGLGIKFLEENKLRPGVKVTTSGLQYEVLVEGTGERPLATSLVKVNYTGKLINGKVFDSTEGGEPAEFPLNRVIPGWTEGVQLMRTGSTYRFYIPSDLAYGEEGQPQGGIGPHEVLVFDVELIGFK
jgi:FKBP-type peptidyl-prolyl cis-trans isomerase